MSGIRTHNFSGDWHRFHLQIAVNPSTIRSLPQRHLFTNGYLVSVKKDVKKHYRMWFFAQQYLTVTKIEREYAQHSYITS
jgi:hypothetical protein